MLKKIFKWLKGPGPILHGTRFPTKKNGYKARNGFYYNGYFGSADCAEDAFGDATKKISEHLEKDLGLKKE